MNKSIQPKTLIILGIILYLSFYLVGGLIGSALAWLGLLLFLFGIAGLFTKKKQLIEKVDEDYTYDELVNTLNKIKHGNATKEQKKLISSELVKNSSLTHESKEQLLNEMGKVYENN